MITIGCTTLMLAFLVMQTSKLISKDDPFFSMTTVVLDWQQIDLWSLGFMFAIEDIDPRVGRINVKQTSWTQDAGKVETFVKMVPCTDPNYVSNNAAFKLDNLLRGRKDSKFLCPTDLESLTL